MMFTYTQIFVLIDNYKRGNVMATDVHLIKKILLKPANRTINVADIVKRNELERKEEKKHNLIFVTAALSTLVVSLFIISL